eukprot:jgi/Chlat1/724/Chrsp104S01296
MTMALPVPRASLARHAVGSNAMVSYSITAGAIEPEKLFNRQYELDQQRLMSRYQPKGIVVIHGPRSCGKTKILKTYVKLPEASMFALAFRPALDVLRVVLRAAISQKMDDSTSVFTKLEKISGVSKSFPQQDPLGAVLDAYGAVLDMWARARQEGKLAAAVDPGHVLIIDEANLFMSWAHYNQPQLDQLLAFFVRATKQMGLCHVIFASTEFAFLKWITRRVGVDICPAYVFGDFAESDAREYLGKQLQSNGHSGVLDDHDGALVYEVCMWWERKSIEKCGYLIHAREVMGGRRNYSTAAEAIVQSSYAAVGAAALMRKTSDTAVDAMIEANLLDVRASPNWARDLDERAFTSQDNTRGTSQSCGKSPKRKRVQHQQHHRLLKVRRDDELIKARASLARIEQDIAKTQADIKKARITQRDGWQEDIRTLLRMLEPMRVAQSMLTETIFSR